MARSWRFMVAALVAALGISTFARAADDVKVGDDAPDFTAVDQEGKEVSLSDFKGKPVVLTFSRAHW